MPLSNLKELRDNMEEKGWTICSFLFKYKGIEYIVLVKRFVGIEKKKDQYALVKLHFMKSNDLSDDLQVEANIRGLIIKARVLREYFGIEYQKNLGNILKQFAERLGNEIPKDVPKYFSDIETTAMVRSLSKSDSEDPNKIYCNKVRRNPSGGRRSEFNADKTKLLRPELFKYFSNEPNISFCYYSDPSLENDDTTILRNFAQVANNWKTC